MSKKFNRKNCDSRLRATITDKWGRTVSLFGTYAFEWSIVIDNNNGKISISSYPNGRIARKHFNEFKKKK